MGADNPDAAGQRIAERGVAASVIMWEMSRAACKKTVGGGAWNVGNKILALLSAVAVSLKAKAALIDKYSDAEKAFYAPAGEFETLTGVSKKEAETLEKRDISRADRILAACARQGIRAVTMQDADYPRA